MHRRTMIAVTLATLLAATGHPLAQARQAPTPNPTLIDLNTASAQLLQSLPGIGPRLAERIVEYREQRGRFQKVEELMNVRGVGEKSFLKLRALVTVTPPPTKSAGS